MVIGLKARVAGAGAGAGAGVGAGKEGGESITALPPPALT